jgi:hypothetical protein
MGIVNYIFWVRECLIVDKSMGRKSLYIAGGIAALLAVFVFRRNLGAEMTAFKGFGLFSVPAVLPVTVLEWFDLLQNNPIVGLTLLDVFDLVEFALFGVLLGAVCSALWEINRWTVASAAACGITGIIICFGSNQAIGMYQLSQQYSLATTVAQRGAIEGSGVILLTSPWNGLGLLLGLFLVLLAGLLVSLVMLSSLAFGKGAAISGILANGIGLAYFPVLALAPMLYVIPPVLSAPFRMVWYFLIAVSLFKLAKKQPQV